MRFAIPPRQLRLGGWSLGARSARGLSFVSFVVFAGSLGIFGCTWASLGGPWGSLGTISGVPWSSWELLEGPWEVPGECQGLPRGLWKSLKNHCFLLYFQQLDVPWGSWGPWGVLGRSLEASAVSLGVHWGLGNVAQGV